MHKSWCLLLKEDPNYDTDDQVLSAPVVIKVHAIVTRTKKHNASFNL